MFQQLKSGFERTIKWNKYKSDPKQYNRNPYSNWLIDTSFQVVNKLFVLSFEKAADRITHREYFLAKLVLKDYNVKIDGRNFFDRPINNDIETYKNIRKSATGQGDYYQAGCLLH